MKVELWLVGKTNEAYLKEGMEKYQKRLQRYLPLQVKVIPEVKASKKMPSSMVKGKEGDLILSRLDKKDWLILLDERGKDYDSVSFASFLEQQLQNSYHKMIFLIGGAYGFSTQVYERANFKLSLSRMTFSHQMIRLFFLEQFYRAMTIIRNEPYHHS